MANKRTIINADEELIIQGKLTVEGEFVQKEFVETISYSESKFAGDFLVVNSDGYDLSNNPTDATLRLRRGSANADIAWDGTAFVFSQDIHVANIVSTGSLTGYLDGTANLAHQFTSPVTVGITGDATGSSSFTGAGNTATIVTTLVPQTTLTAGTYGDAVSVPTITVAGNGIVRSVTNTSIDHDALLNFVADEHIGHSSVRILAGAGLTGGGDITADRSLNVVAADSSIVVNADNIQVSESWVEGLFSVTNTAGGDGDLSYAAGVFTYTGPDQAEANARIDAAPLNVRAHLSASDAGGDGSFSYNSSTGVFTYTGPSPAEVRAHLSASNGVDFNVATGAFQAVEAEIQHDSLDGFVADEHIAHSTVILTAGAGLASTGTGDITASRTFDIGQGTGITVNADSIQTNDSEIVHDALSGFVTNEHIDHSTVILTAGDGLTGGNSDLTASQTFSVDASVVRTSGDQSIAGVKTFTGEVDLTSATITGGITVAGDLTVEGVFNTENVVDTYVQDTKITLNSNNTVTDNTVSIEVNRPVAGVDTAIRWDENNDKWQFTNDGSTYHDMLTTGQTTALFSVANPSGFGNLSYDAGTGTITHVGTSQQDIRDQFSTTGTGIDYDVNAGEFQANVSEIRGYVSAVKVGGDGAFTYDSGTGAFSYTGPGLTEAQGHILSSATQVRSHFTGGEAININSGTISLGNVTQTINFDNGIIKIQNDSISIGATAGTHAVGEGNAIAIGNEAGAGAQDRNSVAVGFKAGSQSQYRDSVAIGHLAGNDEQGVSAGAGRAVAVGFQAGQTNQGGQSLALGESAGLSNQGQGAVAIGTTAGAVYQGEFAVAIGPSAGKGTGSPFTRQANNSIVIRAGDSSYPDVTGANIGAFYVSPIRQNSDDTSNVLMYNFDEKEVTSVASTIFVSSTANQTVSGTKTFSGELVVPDSSSTTDGAIYYDNTINDAYIYINGVAKKITPAVDAGDVEAVGAGTYDVYAGTRVDGPTTYHGIKSINQGSYMSISEASNVITIGADISSIRGAFSASDNGGDGSFSYNSGTGAFTYTGPSAADTRAHFSASGLLSYNSSTGAFSTSADNYGNWNFRTDSGAGSQESVTSNETISILGGTNITVTNSGGTITIANDNSADINGVNAGAGLTGGGGSGTVTLNVVAGDGIIVNPDSVTVDSTVVRTTGAQTIAGDKTFSDAVQVDSLNIANNYDFPTTDGSTNQVLATDGSGQLSFQDVTAIGGTITGVTAGAGLTGGGVVGTVALDIGAGTGISVNANDIAVNMGAFDTSDLSEHSSALYYTDARARAAISVSDSGGDGALSYNSGTGVITYTGPSASQVRAHLSGSSGVNYNSTTGAITADTAEIRALFSASGSLSYNASTGVFSFTDTDTVGTVTSVSVGTGLDVSNGTTTPSISLDLSELTDMTADVVGANDELILLDSGAERKKAINEFKLSQFNNDQGWTSNVGDITAVTAGSGLTGGGSSGGVTLNVVGGSGITANANDIAIDYDGLAGDMLPTTDSTYDLGSDSKRWSQGWFDDVYTSEIYSGTTTSGTTSAPLTIEAQAISNTTLTSTVDRTAGSTTVHGGNSFAFNATRDIPGEPGTGMGGIGGDLNLYGGSGSYINGDVNIGTSQTRYIYLDNNRWPTSGGSTGQVLTVGSSGVLSWASPTVGDITGVTAGTNLNGGGSSGSVTLNLDTTLSGMTAATFSGTVSANLFSGTATSARYADLAEKYESDATYECGTVVVYGGEKEITVTDQENDHRVAGVISTDPAYMMNSEADGQYVALRGRVPCKVIGPVKKGDVLITSNRPGFAMASDQPHAVSASCIVGKSLQNFDGTEGVVEVVV